MYLSYVGRHGTVQVNSNGKKVEESFSDALNKFSQNDDDDVWKGNLYGGV